MRRREFLSLLEETLNNNDEREQILKYYNDLILDAVDSGEREEDVIRRFEVYPTLKKRSKVFEAIDNYEKKPSVKHSSQLVGVIILFFASPILLPIGIALFALLISLVAVLLSLVVSFGASALAVVVYMAVFLYELSSMQVVAAEYVCYIGVGLVCFSLLSALTYYSVKLLKYCFLGFFKGFGKILRKKGVKYETN